MRGDSSSELSGKENAILQDPPTLPFNSTQSLKDRRSNHEKGEATTFFGMKARRADFSYGNGLNAPSRLLEGF